MIGVIIAQNNESVYTASVKEKCHEFRSFLNHESIIFEYLSNFLGIHVNKC
jgi:hypothetical protein